MLQGSDVHGMRKLSVKSSINDGKAKRTMYYINFITKLMKMRSTRLAENKTEKKENFVC